MNTLTSTTLALLLLAAPALALAQDKAAAKPRPPLGRFLSVRSPIDDSVTSKVRNAGLKLAGRAEKEGRKAVLVLEITPGDSQFHHVQGLASLLSGSQFSPILTVAWIKETVTGNKAVVALACNEIVMHPDAELGDISLGQPLEKAQRQFIQSLVEKRLNPKVNWPLARGMLDRQAVIKRVTIEGPGGAAKRVRVVEPEDVARIRQENPGAMVDVDEIKEAGDPGVFSGQRARALDVLAVQTAEDDGEVAAIYGLPRRSTRQDPTAGTTVVARLIKIDGMIEPNLQSFVNRQINRAIDKGVNLLVFEIDSGGGFLHTSKTMAFDIAALREKNIRTVAWIPNAAHSGAALIALGCDEIYMHPDAQIGDAAPIEIREGQQFEHVPQKILSPLRDDLSALAKKKGRPPALWVAMADMNLEVFRVVNGKTGEVTYKSQAELDAADRAGEQFGEKQLVEESRRDNVLTVNGTRAAELSLIEPTVSGIEELKQELGIPGVPLEAVERTWVDNLAIGLSGGEAAFLLFFFGSILVYLELYTLTGLCGIASALCFALFFWARWGQTAGWLEVVLFLLGLALIAIEIFLVPGFGVFGLSGGLLVFVSLIMASETLAGSVSFEGLSRFGRPTVTLVGSLATVMIVAAVISRYLPSLPLLKHIVLEPPGPDDMKFDPRLVAGSAPGASLLEADAAMVGEQGSAVTVLRPAGKARINEELIDVVSIGPFIQPGTEIEVVRIEGNRVVVREVNG